MSEEKFHFILGKLVSHDVFSHHFACQLQACKGSCCWKGDFGAPLTQQEKVDYAENVHDIKDHMTPQSRKTLEQDGTSRYFSEMNQYGTSLNPDGSCIFMQMKNGVSQCLIEQQHKKDDQFPEKPESCLLYPIRVRRDPQNNLEILEYDRWDICSPACEPGSQGYIPLFRFVKKGLILRYGKAFYEAMEMHFERLQEAQ